MRWSIRYRLFVPLGLLLLGVVGISAWSALTAARQAEERIARQVKSVTHTLAGASIALTPRILEQMKGLSGADYLFIDADGKRMSSLKTTQIDLPNEILQQASEDESERLGTPIEIDGQHYRCRRLPQRSGGNLFILYPETSLNEAIRDAIRPALVFGLFGGVAAVVLMYWIGQRLVGRIRELERRTRQIAEGDFSPMPLPSQNDELRDLSQSVNDMAGRLARFQETVRTTEQFRLLGQLSSGLAHQLRNSVTGARLAIQLHEQDCPPRDREALQVALRQLNLMEANLRRFMDLGKREMMPTGRCSISALIDEVIALLHPQAQHARVELRWGRPNPDLEVEGDAIQLRDVFVNIISNAVEAAAPAGTVEIIISRVGNGIGNETGSPLAQQSNGVGEGVGSQLQSQTTPDPFSRGTVDAFSGGIAVEIIDTGSGPPVAIAERLFDPFITGKPEGIGLGLAVARHAIEMHRGRISWQRDAGKTIFRVELPARRD